LGEQVDAEVAVVGLIHISITSTFSISALFPVKLGITLALATFEVGYPFSTGSAIS